MIMLLRLGLFGDQITKLYIAVTQNVSSLPGDWLYSSYMAAGKGSVYS